MSDELHTLTIEDAEQLVVFQIAGEYYGVDISAVNTIIRMQEVTDVPRTAEYVKGVINLRGHIIPVVNLRMRFGMPEGEITKASRIVVVESADQLIGLAVDAVAETLRLPKTSIEPPSPVISNVGTEYLRGVGKADDRLVILLDIGKVLAESELQQLAGMDTGRTEVAA